MEPELSNTVERLKELFGVPEQGVGTDCHIGGRTLNIVVRNGEHTGHYISNSVIRYIVSEKGERIAKISGRRGTQIKTLEGKPTGYSLSGPNGRSIIYVKAQERGGIW